MGIVQEPGLATGAEEARVGPERAEYADVATIDGIIAALYACISGPAGAPREWARQRALFVPGARLVPIVRDARGEREARLLDLDGYERSRTPLFESRGFHEREIARREERYGSLAHVFSTYEAREHPDGPTILRGINSIQLLWREERWWVLSIAWEHEADDTPIPARYLRWG